MPCRWPGWAVFAGLLVWSATARKLFCCYITTFGELPHPRSRIKRMMMHPRLSTHTFAWLLGFAENWAQLAGDKQQNVAVSANSPWRARWGHAVTVIENRQNPNAEPLPVNQRTRLYVLGGETYVTEDVPGTLSYGGSGQLMNDIWRSQTVGTCTHGCCVKWLPVRGWEEFRLHCAHRIIVHHLGSICNIHSHMICCH